MKNCTHLTTCFGICVNSWMGWHGVAIKVCLREFMENWVVVTGNAFDVWQILTFFFLGLFQRAFKSRMILWKKLSVISLSFDKFWSLFMDGDLKYFWHYSFLQLTSYWTLIASESASKAQSVKSFRDIVSQISPTNSTVFTFGPFLKAFGKQLTSVRSFYVKSQISGRWNREHKLQHNPRQLLNVFSKLSAINCTIADE